MQRSLHHPMRPDRTARPPAWRDATHAVATWLWPPMPDDHVPEAGDEAWSTKTMRWVPLVIPLSALFMLLLAVLIGSRL